MKPTIGDEHMAVVHGDGSECPDGCDAGPLKPTVKLIGEDGNVFNVIGRCRKALAKVDPVRAKEFTDRAFAAGSYDEVLRLAMTYCEVE